MVKKLHIILSIVILFTSWNLYGQVGSEWIVPSQQYCKIHVWKDGFYAIPLSSINQSGVDVSDIDKIQVWRRGVEQSVLIQNDSLIFFGKRNDGTLDSILYVPGAQPHKYFNTHSDTSVYFVTKGSMNGKRIETILPPNNSVNLTILNSIYLNVTSVFYYQGPIYSIETRKSDYDFGEGFFGSGVNKLNSSPGLNSYTIPISNAVNNNDFATLECQVVGFNRALHEVRYFIGNPSSPDFTVTLPPFFGNIHASASINIPSSYLVGKNSVTFSIQTFGNGNGVDIVGPSYMKLSYPKSPVLTLDTIQYFKVYNPNNYQVIFSNTNSNLSYYSFDENNINKISTTYLTTEQILNFDNNVKTILVHNGVYLSTYKINTANLNIPTNTANFIIIHGDALESSSLEYAKYRNTISGGSYDTLRLSTSKIMDVFSYGEFTPVGIKRFFDYIRQHSEDKYVLILGKGVNMSSFVFSSGRKFYRLNPEFYYNHPDPNNRYYNMVPTYGSPGSDLMYSIDSENKFRIPTGRVTAKTNEEVIAYLNKVKEHEALGQDLLWRKNLLHLSGGKSAQEILLYKSYVDEYKQYAESDWFGGKVIQTLVKNLQNGAVDDQLKFSISDILNDGVGHMCFFGHSSSQTIDVDIGFVSNPLYGYNNKGKYPFFIVNGCSSADIFDYFSFSEDWILTPDKGAINILGHSDIGYSFNLYDYSRRFYYERFSTKENLTLPIGLVHKFLVDSLLRGIPYDVVRVSHAQQMVLSGDPAIRTYPVSLPDYAIYGDADNRSPKAYLKSYNGNVITAKDSFQIVLPVFNYGSTDTKPVEISIRRFVSNQLVESYTLPINKVRYLDTFYLKVPVSLKNVQGINRFEIKVDPLDSLNEISENNNLAILNYFVPFSSVLCVYPYNYSIVNQQPITLIAQASNSTQINSRDFYFEIDTSKQFNSPAFKSQIVSGSTLARWNTFLLTDLFPSDSIVYFWRVRFNDIATGEDTLWDNHSFIYIKNSSTGWAQSVNNQFNENSLSGLSIQNDWSYITNSINLSMKAVGSLTGDKAQQSELVLNNIPLLTNNIYNNCTGPGGLLLLVLDKNTLQPKIVNPNAEGWRYCGQNFDTRAIGYFPYPNLSQTNTPSVRGIDAIGFMNAVNQVSNGDYVIVMSNGNSWANNWIGAQSNPSYPSLKDFFTDSLKSTKVQLIENGDPYILIHQKGSATNVYEDFVDANGAENVPLLHSRVLVGTTTSGFVTTPLIGPTIDWKKLYVSIDSTLNDNPKIQLIRFNMQGIEIDTIAIPIVDSLDLTSGYLTNSTHGYCKLLFSTTDTTTFKPASIDKWLITYNPSPEGILDPSYHPISMYQNQQKIEGDTLFISYTFENISFVNFTSPIKVVFETRNTSLGKIVLDTVTLSSLPAGNKISYTYKLSTKGLQGTNSLTAFFNPRFQLENIYTNNSIQTFFTVERDKINPTMDVAFDGIKIFDGDIVSPTPIILITLRDNNKNLLMNDPTSLEVLLQYPGQTVPVQINSTHPFVLSWRLDNAISNTFVAELKPTTPLPDGNYILYINGQDASGNKSGTNKYAIRFTVVNKPMVSNFYPYPNPFSSSTRFVFTLTGSKVPDNIKIQIMTVSGKVVREITKEELGFIRIGNNISEYAWDGTDEFGDRLANGVYLYRVIIQDSLVSLEHLSTSGDKAFHKDFGKLYILR
jgi:hypothetical protein